MVSFVVFKLVWALKFFSTIFTFHYFLRMLQSLMSFQFLLGRIIPSTVTSIFTYQTCTTNENYIKPTIFIPLEWHLLPKNVLITKYEGALGISKKRYILLPICVKNLHGRCHKWPFIDLGCGVCENFQLLKQHWSQMAATVSFLVALQSYKSSCPPKNVSQGCSNLSQIC